MTQSIYDALVQTVNREGGLAAVEQLCTHLREQKDYANLFYAMLVSKRLELKVSPVPTESAQSLPESVHAEYEEAIRQTGRTVGELFLAQGDIPRAWAYFRMIGETGPIARALAERELEVEEDPQPLIDIAYHQQIQPRKGFDWILERYGICSAITMASGQEFADPAARVYCIQRLVRADRKSTRLNSSHSAKSRMPSSA